MKIKVSEAKEIILDWMVAQCEGEDVYNDNGRLCLVDQFTLDSDDMLEYPKLFEPSTDWLLGGVIIEREEIGTFRVGMTNWKATFDYRENNGFNQYGPTLLIAGIRCYVASKLGDEVEIPEELK